MRVLVTGGNGFIGRRLVALLRLRGAEVVVLDKEDGGVLNVPLLSSAIRGADSVFHLGAVSGYPFFPKAGAAKGTETNCVGTVNVLDAARKADVKRLVFVSTQSCYAETPVPHMEDGPITCPNAYVATKLFGERMVRLWWETQGLEAVILRLSSVYGIGEESKGPVANPVTLFIQAAVRGEPPLVFGDGAQTRDLLYADDAARAMVLAVGPQVTPGETYNVATSTETTYNDAVRRIAMELGRPVVPRYGPWESLGQQKRHIARQWASFEKFHRATRWVPMVSVEEGIRRVVRWTRDEEDTPIEA